MKKMLLITFLAILSTTPAYAAGVYGHGWGRGGGWGWGWRGDWIAPALIGGAIAYDLAYPYPYYAPYYAPYPYYASPVYAQPQPLYAPPAPAYAPPAAAPSAQHFWYFCAASKGYYPYVASCEGGWQAVPTTPPDALPDAPDGAAPSR